MSAASHANPVTQAGFTMIPNAVVLDDRLSLGAKLVYGYLKHIAWRNGSEKVESPLKILCRDLGSSENTIRGYIKELQEVGLVESKRRGLGLPNIYIIYDPSPQDVVDGNGEIEFQEMEESRFPPCSQDLEVLRLATTAKKSEASPTKEDRDSVWDALVEQFGTPTTTSHRKRFGKVQRELLSDSSLSATQVAEEVPRRVRRYKTLWPDMTLTLEALAKHWPDLRNGNGSAPAVAFPESRLSAQEFGEWRRTATREQVIRYQHEFDVDDQGELLDGSF